MFFNSIKEIDRLTKEINRLLRKGMSNIYLKVTIETFSKLQVTAFRKFVTRSVFRELQLTQVSLNFKTSCCNLKIRCLKEIIRGGTRKAATLKKALFLIIVNRLQPLLLPQSAPSWMLQNSSRSVSDYDVLKSKSPCILLNKNMNFNQNETESKTENPTHNFRETNLVLQLI